MLRFWHKLKRNTFNTPIRIHAVSNALYQHSHGVPTRETVSVCVVKWKTNIASHEWAIRYTPCGVLWGLRGKQMLPDALLSFIFEMNSSWKACLWTIYRNVNAQCIWMHWPNLKLSGNGLMRAQLYCGFLKCMSKVGCNPVHSGAVLIEIQTSSIDAIVYRHLTSCPCTIKIINFQSPDWFPEKGDYARLRQTETENTEFVDHWRMSSGDWRPTQYPLAADVFGNTVASILNWMKNTIFVLFVGFSVVKNFLFLRPLKLYEFQNCFQSYDVVYSKRPARNTRERKRFPLEMLSAHIHQTMMSEFIINKNLPNPMSSSSSSSDSSFFFSSFFSATAATGAAAAAAPAAGAAPTPEPMFVIKSLTLMPSKALAKRDGQYGSTSTLAAFKIVEIFSLYTPNNGKERSTNITSTLVPLRSNWIRIQNDVFGCYHFRFRFL